MYFKRRGSTVFGVQLNANEEKVLDAEIQKQLRDFDRRNTNEIDATILWQLHVQLGFGAKRLKDFHSSYAKEFDALMERYGATERGECAWLCTYKLKEIGVDIEEWNKELDRAN